MLASRETNYSDYNAIGETVFGDDRGVNLGLYLLGMFFDAVLGGVMLHQVITWFSYSREDRRLIRYIVYFTSIISVAFTIFIVATNMHYFVYGFGQYGFFFDTHWLGWPIFLVSLVATAIQIFYIDRVFRLNNNNTYLAAFISLLVAISFIMAIMVNVTMMQISTLGDAVKARPYFYSWLSTMVLSDLLITGFVGWGLDKSKSGDRQTDALINRLIRISAEAQLAPCFITIAMLISVVVDTPESAVFFLECVVSKVYVIGFLAVLNSRLDMRTAIDGTRGTSDFDNARSFVGSRHRATQPARVHVLTETHVDEGYGLHSFNPKKNRPMTNAGEAVVGFDLKEEALDSDKESGTDLDYQNNLSRTGLTEDASHKV